MPWRAQSSETVENSGPTSVTEGELTHFVDATNSTPELPEGYHNILVKSDALGEGDLKEFLARPVRISTFAWSESDVTGTKTSLDPWSLFLNTAIIKKKLDNYAFLRGNLHVKFVVNASPFYYGLMMASYFPLPNFTGAGTLTATAGTIVSRSQRPHVMLLPSDSLGGELKLPFLYPANYLPIQAASDVAEMGLIYYDILAALQSANGVTGQSVTIQTFAWLEDVELQGPTVGLALQSEYSRTGPISAPASAVAAVASKLTSVPFIGKFAKATEIGATALGSVASLFGFTNVPVLRDTVPYRPSPYPQLASCELGYPVEKLTVDPKNELAIDGAPLGLELEDDLQISRFVQRESILTIASWGTSDLVDAQIFRLNVSPDLHFTVANTAQDTAVYSTPMGYISRMFRHWRGDIIVRFDFIKSKYHRGRVIAAWEPRAATNNVASTPNTMGTVATRVMDLGSESSMEIRIPYAQAYPWLKNATATTAAPSMYFANNASDASAISYLKDFQNGVLTLRVMNVLTAPVASSTISVVVSVRGADNLEFANPMLLPRWSLWAAQSQRTFETPTEVSTLGVSPGITPHRAEMNMGETIRSLRQLLRRSILNETWEVASDTTNQLAVVSHTTTKYPLPYGYDPAGPWTAKGLNATGSTFQFNYTANTYHNWLAPCFAGVRGSMMWHFNALASSANTGQNLTVRVSRSPTSSAISRDYFTQATKTGINDANFWLLNTARTHGGTAVTSTGTCAGLSVSIPNMSGALMQPTAKEAATNISSSPIAGTSDTDLMTLEIPLHPAQGTNTRCLTIEKYCAVGTDYSLIFFISCPVWFAYSGNPAP